MTRRFYVFNSPAAVEKHIAEVKTVADLAQLRADILASQTNLVRFQTGSPGVWAIDYAPEGCGQFLRHIFITNAGLETFSPIVGSDCDSFSVLREGGRIAQTNVKSPAEQQAWLVESGAADVLGDRDSLGCEIDG